MYTCIAGDLFCVQWKKRGDKVRKVLYYARPDAFENGLRTKAYALPFAARASATASLIALTTLSMSPLDWSTTETPICPTLKYLSAVKVSWSAKAIECKDPYLCNLCEDLQQQ